MNWRQTYVLNSLFAAANSNGEIDKDVIVLHDAPFEDVAFMNQLIKEGSVVAYRPKRKGHPFNCFVFGGFTEKGLKAYWPIVEAELKAKCGGNKETHAVIVPYSKTAEQPNTGIDEEKNENN